MVKVAIIPARGGSKRIPRKNIREFYGKPIIAYSIEAAIEAGCFDRVIVSTDDSDIAVIANYYGAETPFTRPPELSDDYATTGAVIKHALMEIGKEECHPTHVCCIYATAPFIQKEFIVEAFDKLSTLEPTGIHYVFSAAEFAYPIQRAFKLDASNRVEMNFPEHYTTRSQDLDTLYHDAAQFYWGCSSAFLNEEAIIGKNSSCVVLPAQFVQDIDTEEDWQRAELMYRAYAS